MTEVSSMTAFDLAASDCRIVQIDGWEGTMVQFEHDLARTLGGQLPKAVGETVRLPDSPAIRVAPRRFWLLCNDADPTPIDIDPELGCSLVLSDSRVRFRLTGTRLKHVLERCIAVDWDALKPGYAVQTGLHRVPVLLLRTDEFECDLIVPRSFARSLSEWIFDTAAKLA